MNYFHYQKSVIFDQSPMPSRKDHEYCLWSLLFNFFQFVLILRPGQWSLADVRFKDFYIKADHLQYTLYEEPLTRKEPSKDPVIHGHYHHLENALKMFIVMEYRSMYPVYLTCNCCNCVLINC